MHRSIVSTCCPVVTMKLSITTCIHRDSKQLERLPTFSETLVPNSRPRLVGSALNASNRRSMPRYRLARMSMTTSRQTSVRYLPLASSLAGHRLLMMANSSKRWCQILTICSNRRLSLLTRSQSRQKHSKERQCRESNSKTRRPRSSETFQLQRVLDEGNEETLQKMNEIL